MNIQEYFPNSSTENISGYLNGNFEEKKEYYNKLFPKQQLDKFDSLDETEIDELFGKPKTPPIDPDSEQGILKKLKEETAALEEAGIEDPYKRRGGRRKKRSRKVKKSKKSRKSKKVKKSRKLKK